MSGINKMMDKMKQKKMTLDDLPSPTMENRETRNDAVHTGESKSVNTAVQPAVHKEVQEAVRVDVSTAKRDMQQAVNAANVANGESLGRKATGGSINHESVDVYAEVQHNRNALIQQYSIGGDAAKQQNRPMKKVTYYLTEEMHKAFEDVYARRILEGRKTDKSTLISEAVELLHKSEMARYSNAT